ncbi:uncharacterized mitochondrial protein AtMg00810-like [Nicotiana sylvestris]|uniref:uncharacterized mitochondrial protein AtMg00810-like n=1 Tax=Nicotiana sylvestris TaxID=4096 RepID=UPI00388CCE33
MDNIITPLESEVQTRSRARNSLAFSAFLSQIEPKNIKKALKDADWITAMQDELHQFERNNVWHLVPRPSDRTIIGTRWVFRNKLDEHGITTRNKVRLVVQGYNQEEGIVYDEMFAPVYVDDIIFGATADSLCAEFAKLMGSEFEMSMMGELNFFLGLQVKQSPKGIFICQQKYINGLLKRFDMETSKVIDTPIAMATRLDMDETGSPINQTMYRGIIVSLLYLTANRPDIVFSVGICASFQSNPKESHLKAAKRILRYLKGTQDLVLYYPSSNNFNLIGYADVDYTGNLVDKKSTSGMPHFLGSCLISWGTRKQNSVALSTAEAEYVASASCCAQLLWIKQQLDDFRVLTNCVALLCDNTSALNMTKNPVQHKRTKHIDVRHHFLRDNVEKGLICMKFCSTEDQIADIFTKTLSREQFERNRVKLGLLKPN